MFDKRTRCRPSSFLTFAVLLLSALTAEPQVQNQWTYGYFDGGQVSALAEESSQGAVLYASSATGIYKTTDSGGHWALLKNSPPETYLLAWDATARLLYAANRTNTWKSDDHGASWIAIFHAPYSPPTDYPVDISGLAASANNVYVAYRGTVNGQGPLFVSGNAGQTWNSVSPLLAASTGSGHAASIFDLKVDPFQSGLLYINTGTNSTLSNGVSETLCVGVLAPCEVFASYGGVTNSWKQLGFVPSGAGAIYPERDAQGTLWNYTSGLISKYSCSNGSCGWAADSISANGAVRSLLVDGCLDFEMVAGTDTEGVAEKPFGSAVDWQYSNQLNGLGNNQTSLAVGPIALHCSTGVFATLPAGVWLSQDITSSWTERDTGITAVEVTTLAMAPDSVHTVYAGTLSNGIFKSADAGKTWIAANDGLKYQPSGDEVPRALIVTAIAVHPQKPNIVLAGTSQGLFRSSDAGASWTRISNLDSLFYGAGGVNGIIPDTFTPGTFYAVINGGPTIAVSKDGGLYWTEFPVSPNAYLPSTTPYLNVTPLAAISHTGRCL